jgi:hypothetical protein
MINYVLLFSHVQMTNNTFMARLVYGMTISLEK